MQLSCPVLGSIPAPKGQAEDPQDREQQIDRLAELWQLTATAYFKTARIYNTTKKQAHKEDWSNNFHEWDWVSGHHDTLPAMTKCPQIPRSPHDKTQ